MAIITSFSPRLDVATTGMYLYKDGEFIGRCISGEYNITRSEPVYQLSGKIVHQGSRSLTGHFSIRDDVYELMEEGRYYSLIIKSDSNKGESYAEIKDIIIVSVMQTGNGITTISFVGRNGVIVEDGPAPETNKEAVRLLKTEEML